MSEVRTSSFYDFVENVACGFDDHCVMLQRDPVSRGSLHSRSWPYCQQSVDY
jgi:hypothetical protein